jgi:hypothetical protein
MITAIVYHQTVPNQKNQEKLDLLKYFSQGIGQSGDQAIDCYTHNYTPTKVAVIQGWVHESSKSSPHLNLRNTVITQQLIKQQYVVAVDSNLFLYANSSNPGHYLRYSFNGVFPNTGIYCDTVIDPARWQKISAALNISLKPYRQNGNHILLCLQRNGGWSMGKFDVASWANQTIAQLRQYTDRPIVIRAHPGDKGAKNYMSKILGRNVTISRNVDLVVDLQNCWAAVNHNSSPVVGAAIEGVPIFVTDTSKSQCREIANTDLAQIENPLMPDRQAWAERLSMFHWNFDELRSGECWQHMRKFI